MPSAERNASNVRVPKKASRIIKNAQASETMSSVRATEQLRSVLREIERPLGGGDLGFVEAFVV
jgi:hypothetical protein